MSGTTLQPTIPGVYIQEIPNLPPSIVSVPTAIPAFIGYTAQAKRYSTGDLSGIPFMIESITEYQQYYGGAYPETGLSVAFGTDSYGNPTVLASVNSVTQSKYLMFYCLQTFFDNGGGQCYIVSVGGYPASGGGVINKSDLTTGLNAITNVDDVTLIVFPDSLGMDNFQDYYALHMAAITQCVNLQNRFTVMDLYRSLIPALGNKVDNSTAGWNTDVNNMRNQNGATGGISGAVDIVKYGAVYFPRVWTDISFVYNPPQVAVTGVTGVTTMDQLQTTQNQMYNMAKDAIANNLSMLLPVSAAVVGVYAQVDNSRGVWKAPANVQIQDAIDLEVRIANADQSGLNVDVTGGYSINAIRYFQGIGSAIIWGARTLAGNDNEWRYVPVRRFFTMVEQSVKLAAAQFVFEPNDMNTWVRVKAMISNYLTEQWKSGALMGSTAAEAYYVYIGLGQTMTDLDILEGRMIVQIGMAAVRPAEFIILQFIQFMGNPS
jgi:phage tail sheath protein FI